MIKGSKCSEKHKQKLSDALKGENHPNFGKHLSEETRQKISEGNKGKSHSKETRQKMSLKSLGKKKSKKHCENISKGRNGISFTLEHKLNISKTRIKNEIAKGSNNPNWQGGISFLPYCSKFNKFLKEKIRERDNYQCQFPGCLMIQLESLVIYHEDLNIHHIHYDKPNCNPDLITLCRKHNLKVNKNRDYWEKYFMDLLKKREILKKI